MPSSVNAPSVFCAATCYNNTRQPITWRSLSRLTLREGKDMSFGENLARLDEVAKRLESEPMSMDEALSVF